MNFWDKLSIAYGRVSFPMFTASVGYLIAYYFPIGWKGIALMALYCAMLHYEWPQRRD